MVITAQEMRRDEASIPQGSEILGLPLTYCVVMEPKAWLPFQATLSMVLSSYNPDFFNISLSWPHVPLVSKMMLPNFGD